MPDVKIHRGEIYLRYDDKIRNILNLSVQKRGTLPTHDGEGHVMSPGGQLMAENDMSW